MIRDIKNGSKSSNTHYSIIVRSDLSRLHEDTVFDSNSLLLRVPESCLIIIVNVYLGWFKPGQFIYWYLILLSTASRKFVDLKTWPWPWTNKWWSCLLMQHILQTESCKTKGSSSICRRFNGHWGCVIRIWQRPWKFSSISLICL